MPCILLWKREFKTQLASQYHNDSILQCRQKCTPNAVSSFSKQRVYGVSGSTRFKSFSPVKGMKPKLRLLLETPLRLLLSFV